MLPHQYFNPLPNQYNQRFHPPPIDNLFEDVVYINLDEGQTPQYHIVTADPTTAVSIEESRSFALPPLDAKAQADLDQKMRSGNSFPQVEVSPSSTGIVNNWQELMNDGFETRSIPRDCLLAFSPTGAQAVWGRDTLRVKDGTYSYWPARTGPGGVNPAVSLYPPNVRSRLLCGNPYNLSNSQTLVVRFDYWMDISDPGDGLFVGLSFADNFLTAPVKITGTDRRWRTFNIIFYGSGINRTNAFVEFLFQSDSDGSTAAGVWIDNLEISRYTRPALTCADSDPSNIGVVLDPYENIGGGIFPIIRPGDTLALDGLQAANARWVRMLLQQQNGLVRLQDYDIMIDTLCAAGISTQAVINQETIVRKDHDVLANATDYRREFADTAGFLAEHFNGRLKYWEIWNEQDLQNREGETDGAFVRPILYAPLLIETSQAIKQASSNAKILYGGLSSAWNRSFNHFFPVYAELARQGAVGGNSPFDYLAIHPYPDYTTDDAPPQSQAVDPNIYLRAVGSRPHQTILDKFMEQMNIRGEGNKKTWVTEIGWNSAEGEQVYCWQPLAVTEQEQALYLRDSFDILFKEVTLWQRSTPAVEKVIWYQYRDVGISAESVCGPNPQPSAQNFNQTPWENRVPLGYIPQVDGLQTTQTPMAWWFGLYQGNKIAPKLARCAFARYPFSGICFGAPDNTIKIYLPIVIKNR